MVVVEGDVMLDTDDGDMLMQMGHMFRWSGSCDFVPK